MGSVMQALSAILLFPGFLFLATLGMSYEFVDRRLYARFQNRQGPPWYQPLADFIKLGSKEEIVPEGASPVVFRALPLIALAAAVTAVLYVPIVSFEPALSFTGDLVVVLYLLTLPTVCFFLAGWYSASLYATIGATRTLAQLFAYEVPLLLSLLAPALLSGSWSITDISRFYAANPWFALINIPAFVVALIALQGKLERVPFDIPEAETEIVSGAFVEYGGRLLALFKLTLNIELVVGCALLCAIFLPFGLGQGPVIGFMLFLVKTLFLLFLLALMRSSVARLRIEQMTLFCWRYVAPTALFQMLVNIIVVGLV